MVTCSSDHFVKLWIGFNTGGTILTRFDCAVYSLAFSACDDLVACGAFDGTIKIVNVLDFKVYKRFEGHTGPVKSLAFDPLQKYLASAGSDGKVIIWEYTDQDCAPISTFTCLSLASVDGYCFNRIKWNPQGSTLAIPSPLGVIIVDRSSFAIQARLTGYMEAICVTWSPNGRFLASSHCNNEVVIWNLSKKNCIEHKLFDQLVCDMHWNPIENSIFMINKVGQYYIWDNLIPPEDLLKECNSTQEVCESQTFESVLDKWNSGDLSSQKNESFYPTIDNDNEIESENVPDAPLESLTDFKSRKLRYYLFCNDIGMITARLDGLSTLLEIEFFEKSFSRNFRISQPYRVDLGAMSKNGLVLAHIGGESANDRSILTYQAFQAWGLNSANWTHIMELKEDVTSVAIGEDWIAAATSRNFLRIFGDGGVQIQVFSLPGNADFMTGWESRLAVLFNYPDSRVGYWVLDVSGRKLIAAGDSLPISPFSKVKWVGFNPDGALTVMDSKNLFIQMNAIDNSSLWNSQIFGLNSFLSIEKSCRWSSKEVNLWTPVLDAGPLCLEIQIKPICITMDRLRYIPFELKENSPRILPKPVPSTVSLQVPLLNIESSRIEESRIRSQISFNYFSVRLVEDYLNGTNTNPNDLANDKALLTAQALLDQKTLLIFKKSCTEEQVERAFGLVKDLILNKSISVSIQLAQKYNLELLAQKIQDYFNEKQEKLTSRIVATTATKDKEIINNENFPIGDKKYIYNNTISSQNSEGDDLITEDRDGFSAGGDKSPLVDDHFSDDGEREECGKFVSPWDGASKKRNDPSLLVEEDDDDGDRRKILKNHSVLKVNPFSPIQPKKSKQSDITSILRDMLSKKEVH